MKKKQKHNLDYILDNTTFASRALAVATLLHPNIKNKIERLALTSEESISKVTHWLHSGKQPPKTKRLELADRLGVSIDYLFEKGEFAPPSTLMLYSPDVYSVPMLSLDDLPNLIKGSVPIAIKRRMTWQLPSELTEKIKATELCFCISSPLDAPPHFRKGDLLLLNLSATITLNTLALELNGESSLSLIETNEEIQPSTSLIPILMNISLKY